jgi:hypothetical protein
MAVRISFDAPATVGEFMRSDAFFRLIAGPVGSGKTTGCIFELLRRAIEQAPDPADGLRKTRFAIVRQTLEQLRMTVLKDIETWLQGIVRYKVSDKTIFVEVGDVRSEWLLIPLEDPEDQRRLLSSQLTGAWMSEAIEINVDLVPALMGRLGRFPSKAQGGPTWFGAIADTNMPTEGSDWHKLMAIETPPDWQIFIQPGGLEPLAENIDNLPGGRQYYERLARGHSEDWVRRYVHAQYGNDPAGSAVFRESFKHHVHVVDEIEPVPGHPIIIGQDFGRYPCSVITQMDHRGRLLVLDEILSEDIGLELHVQRALRPLLSSERYIGRSIYIVGDPAGNQRSTSYEETSFDLMKRMGLMGFPAPTNNIDRRLRSVEAFMLAMRDGGPGFLVDRSRCPTLIQAINGRYRYAKKKSGQLAPLPEKLHPWSDLADALQYACLAIHGGLSGYAINRIQRKNRVTPTGPRITPAAWT